MNLADSNMIDDLVLITSGMILLAVLCGLIRIALCSRPLSLMISTLKNITKVIGTWKKMELDEVGLIVRERLQKQKVDNFRTICLILSICISPYTIKMMVNISKGRVRNYTLAQDIVHLLDHGIVALVSICPFLVSLKTIDYFYTVLLLSLAVYMTPFTCRPSFLFEALLTVDFAMVLLTFARRTTTPVVPLLNLAVAFTTCSSIVMSTNDQILSPPLLALGQFMAVSVITIGAHLVERNAQAIMGQCLEMQATKELLSAACTLLRSFCDVVVELDTDGAIVCPAMDLGSFLLRGPSQCLKGWKLVDLMSNEADRRHFSDKLQEPKPEGMILAEAMHVSMKDGNGAILQLELLWFQFRHLGDKPHYMVGIREFCDLAMRQRPCEQQVTVTTGVNNKDEMAVSDDSEDFTLPETSCVNNTLLGEPVAIAILDCAEEGFPIRGLSHGFCMRIGRLPPMTPFTSLVKHGHDFATWMQGSLNFLAANKEFQQDRQIVLRMPQGEMKVTCRIISEDNSSHSQDGRLEEEDQGANIALDITRVRLLMFNIRRSHSRLDCDPHAVRPSQSKGTPVGLQTL